MTAEGLDSFQPSPAARPSTGHGMSTTAVALVGARPPPPTSTVAVQPGRTDLHHNYYSFYNFRQMKSLNNFVGKIKFYQCFNTILYKARNAGSKLVCIHLLKFVCRLCPHCYMQAICCRSVTFYKDRHCCAESFSAQAFLSYICLQATSTEDVQLLRSVLDLLRVDSYLSDRLASFLTSFTRRFSVVLSDIDVLLLMFLLKLCFLSLL